jgi:4-alpha-glucanotransferase
VSAGTFPPRLEALARAHGVATTWQDHAGQRVDVSVETVRVVLRAMGVDAPDEPTAAEALEAHREAEAERLLPEAHVVRRGDDATAVVPCGALDEATLTLEDGSRRTLDTTTPLRVPDDVPLGYHRLDARRAGRDATATLIVAPGRCPLPTSHQWGWMTQLYQLRSDGSWGMGDARDLRTLAERTAPLGADFVVCNPLHAMTPVPPVQPSPYFPSSRRFANPLYVRIDDVPELDRLGAEDRRTVERLGERARELNDLDRLDYDVVLATKLEALALIHAAGREPSREEAFTAYRREKGQALIDVARFFALAEQHGASWEHWPRELQHPAEQAVAETADRLADRVELHVWLQWIIDEQLGAAHDAARAAGMSTGVIHDLAVGVDPGGADAWALSAELAAEVRVGAPPDAFNQQGQDWGQPPLRPDRLRATGFAPVRDMLRSVLSHAGGVRIDHVLGLFRLFWIPEGASPAEGTYVRYPGDDLLGVLALEAHRADAVVVGEDLGTMEPWVRDHLAEAGALSSRVLYFEHADGERTPAEDYPERALATINTHDLPTATGWWRAAGVRLQSQLGLLGEGRTEEAELERAIDERASMRRLLHGHGLLTTDGDDQGLVEAMHASLASTPSLLVAASPADVVGDTRQPNLPGTTDEYPNWRLPLAEPTATGPRPLSLEQLLADPRLKRHASRLRRPAR